MIVNRVRTRDGVSVGASAVDQPVSAPITVEDRAHFLAKIRVSAISETTGISFSLKESCDGGTQWDAVGNQSSVSAVKKTGTLGTAEVSTTTWPSFAGATQADYLHVTGQDGSTYAVWLDKDNAGTVPTGALYVAATNKIEVDIATGDTAAQVAAKARAAVVANAAWAADFTTGAVATASFTITQVLGGTVTDPAPKNENDSGAGSIGLTVDTPGANGTANLSTEAITFTSHGFVTGDRVIASGSDLPAGLSSGTVYYIIKVDANTVKLASSYANALAGTAVDLTDYGTGTAALYATDYEIRMLIEDSSDAAQLPLWDIVEVVANTGASDSCTVSAVYYQQ